MNINCSKEACYFAEERQKDCWEREKTVEQPVPVPSTSRGATGLTRNGFSKFIWVFSRYGFTERYVDMTTLPVVILFYLLNFCIFPFMKFSSISDCEYLPIVSTQLQLAKWQLRKVRRSTLCFVKCSRCVHFVCKSSRNPLPFASLSLSCELNLAGRRQECRLPHLPACVCAFDVDVIALFLFTN